MITIAQYVNFIKNSLKERASSVDIMNLLFGKIIDIIDLKGKDGEPYSFDPSRTSKICSGQLPINKEILKHSEDMKVIEALPGYFEEAIVPRLSYNKEKILADFLKILRNDDNTSEKEFIKYKMLSSADNIANLLAYIFVSILQEENNRSNLEKNTNKNIVKSSLLLKCIDSEDQITSKLIINEFKEDNNIIDKDRYQRIIDIIEDINEFKDITEPQTKVCNNILASFIQIDPLNQYTQAAISIEDKERISTFAQKHNIKLAEYFFDLDNLEISRSFSYYMMEKTEAFRGSYMAQLKYQKIKQLISEIEEIDKLDLLKSNFFRLFTLKLVIDNIGDKIDRDIIVTLEIPTQYIYKLRDLKKIDIDVLKDIDNEFSLEEISTIYKSIRYLSYRDIHPMSIKHSLPILPGFGMNIDERYEEKWEELFPDDYFYHEENGMMYIQISFDKILQKTAISFPTRIFLISKPEKIRYKIQSLNLKEIFYGEMNVISNDDIV